MHWQQHQLQFRALHKECTSYVYLILLIIIILTTSHQSDIGENNIVSPEAAVSVFLQTDLSLTFGTVGHQSLILKLINLI